MVASWTDNINLKKVCSEYRVGLWQCPQFLFLIMGIIIILAMLVTYVVASRYQEPELAALTVLVLTAILFALGNLVVKAFEKVALSSRSKSEFISIMSHQLRSPLSAIKWQLSLLLQGQSSKAYSTGNYLETIMQQNDRMIRAVNDLLEVNRIEDNDLILRPQKFSLKNLTSKIIEEYNKYASAYNAQISLLADGELPEVFADEERIGRVTEHLLDNAIRYSINGGKITISLENKENKILWKISDEGHGISPAEQKRVFEKYFRSPSAARYQTGGSGVGLFIAKAIIQQSGGEIGFSSQESKGSTFWFSLPINKTS
ncbi:hypothetical protein A3G55_04590 [Candidatus Giovannonibacteria bacterium RIFCSPLOWO2_12_FULL_44_25]|uniref:histidine kinase n=3 Tax=Parcubacteria group TaxID=1794811 RepID=A0A837IGS7_9BACT|nr:MAG: PAS domain S-box protein [Parcubacteria group bacterium GW2011_GWC1_44_10]KKT59865.1 MAG: PAS domain S-box protein [Candidatus Giovannonibacteria bacterium GW2011_GWA1_44_25]KKU12488.1 MAG: PAS domain S-box protein [Candidatus Azambacteria bacterium GW2011_GWC2_45_7b]KKU29851.1 MAG: PAS domain S-box protein [Candidatus Giovannonibacteria bacterium GW2011_GWB1_46_20]OGF48918.1 MAG: hypothetical protein A2120_04930 [Candidatus Giovannonibacteria bacterium GWA2_45_15]OGF59695.1 MAG: hypot